jgi:RNA-binding protein YlmH
MDYTIKKYIDKLKKGKSTGFLDPLEYKLVISKLKKEEYKIYDVYEETDKKILYKNEIPKVTLYKINSYEKLKHQEIMGSLYSLSIDKTMIGDIIVEKDNYYFYILDIMSDFIENNLFMIGNKYITLEQIDLSILKNYKKKYEINTIIVPSLRIDAIISKIINTSRSNVQDLIKDKSIILNYTILKMVQFY